MFASPVLWKNEGCMSEEHEIVLDYRLVWWRGNNRQRGVIRGILRELLLMVLE
jgi:hypothetical protein